MFFNENEHSYEDALRFYAQITLPEERRDALTKQAADMSFVIPGLLGLGAAGTAGYIGMREGRSRGKIRALKDIKDPREREIALEEIESGAARKYFPTALAAGAGAGYLMGAHAPEHLVKSTTNAAGETVARSELKNLSLGKKVLHGPGTLVQRGLRRLGATSNVGKAIAGSAALGAGLFAGGAMGERDARRAIERARGAKKEAMLKQAGLFLKPSDVAGHHHDLSAALEGRLNASPGSGQFKKHASDRATAAALGAVAGGIYETGRRELTQPVEPPPVEEVKGVGNRLRRAVHKARYKGDQFSRRHPVAATALAAGAGAAAGVSTGLGSGARELNKTRKGKV